MSRENQQVQHSVQSENNPIAYSYFTENASSGYNYGLELDTKYLLTKNLIFNMSLGYLESMVNSYTVDEITYGNRSDSNAPKYTSSLSADYTLPDGIRINIEYTGKDAFFISNDSDKIIEGYSLLNASLNYKYKNASFSVWGKNLTNKRYGVKAFYFALTPSFNEDYYIQWGDPIEFGTTIQLDF